MPAKKHPVILTVEKQLALEKAARSNKRSLRERQRARILLASARGQSDAEVGRTVGVHLNTMINVRTRFATAGIKSVHRADRPDAKPAPWMARLRRTSSPWSAPGRPRGARPGQ